MQDSGFESTHQEPKHALNSDQNPANFSKALIPQQTNYTTSNSQNMTHKNINHNIKNTHFKQKSKNSILLEGEELMQQRQYSKNKLIHQTTNYIHETLQNYGVDWKESINSEKDLLKIRTEELDLQLDKFKNKLDILQLEANTLTESYEKQAVSIESDLDTKTVFQSILDQKLSEEDLVTVLAFIRKYFEIICYEVENEYEKSDNYDFEGPKLSIKELNQGKVPYFMQTQGRRLRFGGILDLIPSWPALIGKPTPREKETSDLKFLLTPGFPDSIPAPIGCLKLTKPRRNFRTRP